MKSSIAILCLFACAQTLQAVTLETDQQKFSYVVGLQIGNNLKQGDKIDLDALQAAIVDAYEGKEQRLSNEEVQAVMTRYEERKFAERMEASTSNKKAGEDFLAANKAKDGVQVTESGLQYKVIKSGSGATPKASDNVEVHYHGTLIDGTVFDSSVERGEPITLAVSNVIQGWQEALTMMKAGDKWQVYIPSELGYGERGAGATIGPNSALIFDIELIKVFGAE